MLTQALPTEARPTPSDQSLIRSRTPALGRGFFLPGVGIPSWSSRRSKNSSDNDSFGRCYRVIWNVSAPISAAMVSAEVLPLGPPSNGFFVLTIGRCPKKLTPFLSGRGVSSALKSLQDRLIACVDS